ncbi:uncharacterized protein [Typha angustifolia]|uniref:uncharacterized protein isoform X1 n=1 Tax=Typha angustifolia TaxID=59011 RepID=UPI003C2B375C
MPGSIQVSVLEHTDFSPPPPSIPRDPTATCLSLKVSMGKREYLSAGEGDFSFPVMSLRENLMLMVHNAEGKLISHTELKIMSIVENGKWDVIFPLEGGGNVLLRLRFSLNDKERKRISEMRNSALKRKREELLKGGNNSSIPDTGQKIGDSSNPVIKELETGVRPNTSSLEEVHEYSNHLVQKAGKYSTEANKVALDKQQQPVDGAKERHISFGEFSDPQVERSGFLNLETSLGGSSEWGKDILHSTKRKNFAERSSSTNIRKMISAFENYLPQMQEPGPQIGQKIKTQMTRIKSAGSLRTISPDGGGTKEFCFPQTMMKSSSVEILSELNLQKSPRINELLSLKKNLILDSNDSKNVKSIQESGKQKAVEVIGTASSILESHHSANLHNSKSGAVSLMPIRSEDSVNLDYSVEHTNEKKDIVPFELRKSTPAKFVYKFLDRLKETRLDMPPKAGYNLTKDTAHGSSVEISSSSYGRDFSSRSKVSETEEMLRLGGAAECVSRANFIPVAGNKGPLTMSMDELDASKKKIPLRKEYYTLDMNRSCKSSGEMSSSSSDGRKQDDLGRLDDENGTTENIVSGHIDNLHKVNLEAVHNNEGQTEKDSFQNEVLPSRKVIHEATSQDDVQSHRHIDLTSGICCFGMFGTWMPHHLCLTTGSKQLRDLLECSICIYTPRTEKNILVAVPNEKQKMQGDACGMNRNDKIPRRPGNMNYHPSGTTMLNGWLVAQGARIVVMIVACGTIFLNTR